MNTRWILAIIRLFWTGAMLLYGSIVFACLWAIYVQFEYRTPGRFLFIVLPVIGYLFALLNILFFIAYALKDLPAWDDIRRIVKFVERSTNVLVMIFVCSSFVLYANGELDTSAPTYRPAVIHSGSTVLMSNLPVIYSWVDLRFRDDPNHTQRVLIKGSERAQLWGARPVSVTMHEGYLGIPRVSLIEENWDWYGREIVKIAPSATGVWRKIIFFNLDHNRFQEASTAAQEYFALYPHDYLSAEMVGNAFMAHARFLDAVRYYDLAATQHPTYEAYQHLGTALSYSGNREKAASVLEASIPFRPDEWEAYYHLGYVYRDIGKHKEALRAFEKALELNPNFPEVQTAIRGLKQTIAQNERR